VLSKFKNAAIETLVGLSLKSDSFRHLLSTKDPRFSEIGHSVAAFLAKASDDEAIALRDLLARAPESRAGSLQDVWVLVETRNKRGGFFVEFGATDGVTESNTLLLEKEYGWRGILCEPNPQMFAALSSNRAASIDGRCVTGRTGDIVRLVVPETTGLSFVESIAPVDKYVKARKSSKRQVFDVETVSLHDLLLKHGAPASIDFMSIDTEGAEMEILNAFDFNEWDIRLLCVEHNHTPREAEADALMAANGYERRFDGISRQDAWYRRTS
jgi:FkbM family methyltransferase